MSSPLSLRSGISSREASSTPVAEVSINRGSTVILHDPDRSNPSSTSQAKGAAPTPATRTYDFGDRHVFGPDANQSMLYLDVAKPILLEVLQGYNGTIFAYGQTGTGKTYTMEGDLASLGGTFSAHAGLIPRTLHALFEQLAEDGAQFAVQCSFVEIYNDELRDLNALDFGARSPKGGLRIYEDKESGVRIEGLEETPITSAEEGLEVLKRGSLRRQTAATKCNDHSR